MSISGQLACLWVPVVVTYTAMTKPTRDGKKNKGENKSKEPKASSNGRNQQRNKKRNKNRSENKQIRGKAAAKNITKPVQDAEDVVAVEDEEASLAVPLRPAKLRLRVNVRPRPRSKVVPAAKRDK